ncbi:Arm DNA-binding domain-containing protein [Brucellaceae bacterium C25G]
MIQINPTSSKLWRHHYKFAGKEKMLALGSYPDVSLAVARALRDKSRTNEPRVKL